jgi:hypothetical protein
MGKSERGGFFGFWILGFGSRVQCWYGGSEITKLRSPIQNRQAKIANPKSVGRLEHKPLSFLYTVQIQIWICVGRWLQLQRQPQ